MNTVVKWSNISRRSVLIAVMLFIILFLFWWSILPVPLFQDPYATVLFDREEQFMDMEESVTARIAEYVDNHIEEFAEIV